MERKEDKNKKENIERGITLLALVITIVILIILSAVTINVVLGEGGLIEQAKNAAEKTQEVAKTEQEQLESLANELAGMINESEYPDEQPIPESTSYVGKYADVDGDGTVDGIIYADLAVGGSGTWNPSEDSSCDSYGEYTIPKVTSGLKKYKARKTGYRDDFGIADVVVQVEGTTGTSRFYVMALEDVDSSEHTWYGNAYGNMDDYSTATSTSFGSGKQNTKNMIAKWNSSAYGSQNSDDMWRLSTVQSKIKEEPAWYVPSRSEWAAFGGQLGITRLNYSDKGLNNWYWSSSQRNQGYVWITDINGGYVYYNKVNGSVNNHGHYVRLGATF